MAKYEFTNAAGNRLMELCLIFNKDKCLGCIPYEVVEQFLRDEDYRSEYAVEKFVSWLKAQAKVCSSAAIVLGLVAVGLANEIVRDREFIGKVEAFHTAMNRRFGVDRDDLCGEELTPERPF